MGELVQFPFPYERRLEELLRAYRDAQRTIADQLVVAVVNGQAMTARERRAQLAAALSTLNRLGRETDPLARDILRDAWAETIEFTDELAARRAREAGVTLNFSLSSLSGVNERALQEMERAMLGRMEDARRTAGRQIEDLYARLGRRAVVMGLLGADGSPRSISARLVQELRARGIRSFTDRAGRQWALERYAEMVARTTTREAVVEAAKLRMAATGISLAEVSRSKNPCAICRPWEGQTVSLDGRTREHDGRAVATLDAMPNGGPPFHPNCAHFLMPVVAQIDRLAREMGAV
jgi:hypothetical protein